MKNKKTLIIGASTKPERYAYKAAHLLQSHGHSIHLLGNKPGQVANVAISTEKEKLENLHTVTLYINPLLQENYYDYILGLKPKRVVFNPGTENPAFYKLLDSKHIAYEEACTLVLLNSGQY
jgi:uncharacterized protein